MDIELYFDVVCPFAYLASTQIERIAAEAGARVRWRPILLGGLLKYSGISDPNTVMPAAKRALVRLDAQRQAAWLGVPLRFSAKHPRRTLAAMRLLCAVPEEGVAAVARELFYAAWVLDLDIEDRAVLAEIGSRHGVAVERVDEPAIKQSLHERTDEALRRGVFGVPTLVVGETLLFGADRLSFLREALGLPEDLRAPPIAQPRSAQVEWFHDVASPFSYLASVQLERLGAPVVPRPVLVGALFREIGTPLVPLETFSAAKQAWMRQDMERHARRLGVPFRFPTVFPLRSLHAQRILCLEPRAQSALYQAAWADDRDLSELQTLRVVLAEAGFDGDALLAEAQRPEAKERLRLNTEQAQQAGVCGVPSFLVDGTELFWGQDRMAQVAHAARGWRLDGQAPSRNVPPREDRP
jgi:2-hydroxychromene-2-carboxylate isomerase